MRVLLISWEYPPVIEGGLARHVRKLSEHLVADGTEVHVLTRGGAPAAGRGGAPRRVSCTASASREFPKDPSAFVRWVEAMNADMGELADELLERLRFRPRALPRLAGGRRRRARRAADRPPVADDGARDRVGPPPGLGPEPSAVPHPRRRARHGPPRRPRDHLLALHAQPRRQVFGVRPATDHRDPERDRPARSRAGRRRPRCAARPATPSPTSCWCCWSAGWSTRRAFTSRSTRWRR